LYTRAQVKLAFLKFFEVILVVFGILVYYKSNIYYLINNLRYAKSNYQKNRKILIASMKMSNNYNSSREWEVDDNTIVVTTLFHDNPLHSNHREVSIVEFGLKKRKEKKRKTFAKRM